MTRRVQGYVQNGGARLGRRLLLGAVVLSLASVLLARSGASAGEPPSQVGQWSAPATWPIVAVHMSLDRSGNVLMFDGFGAQ